MSIITGFYSVCSNGCRTGEDCDNSCLEGDERPLSEARIREIVRDEIARLSPAPVGGETNHPTSERAAPGDGACTTAMPASAAEKVPAPTPPPAEPDGGETTAQLKAMVKRLDAALGRCDELVVHHSNRADAARATIAERDRRIAAALDELQAVAAGKSEIRAVFAILDPTAPTETQP